MAAEYGDDPALARRAGGDQRAGGVRRRDGLPGALGGPDPADPAPAGYWVKDTLAADGHDARTRCPSRRRRPRRSTVGRTSSSCCGPTRTCAADRDYPFARGGERSVARGYTKAVEKARQLVYVEDQYLWGHHVGESSPRRCARTPTCT